LFNKNRIATKFKDRQTQLLRYLGAATQANIDLFNHAVLLSILVFIQLSYTSPNHLQNVTLRPHQSRYVICTELSLYINRPEPAIICTSCQYALSPSGEAVTKHLWEKHQIASNLREGLTVYVQLLKLPNPNKLNLRDEGSPPHPHLSIRSGTACKHCDFKTTGLTLTVRHISKAHKCFKGGKNWTRDHIQEHMSLQSWTQNHKLYRALLTKHFL
jgi:hypothetical protein